MGYTSTFGASRKLPLDGSFWVRVREYSIPEERRLIEDELDTMATAARPGADGVVNPYAPYHTASLLERILKERVVAWNLTDDQDAPIPCNGDTILATLSREHQRKIVDALMPERLRFMTLMLDNVLDRTNERVVAMSGTDAEGEAEAQDAAPVMPEGVQRFPQPVDLPAPEDADPETSAGF